MAITIQSGGLIHHSYGLHLLRKDILATFSFREGLMMIMNTHWQYQVTVMMTAVACANVNVEEMVCLIILFILISSN